MQTSANFYKIEGHKYDRVTRITGMIPKQNILINWAAKITAEAAADIDQQEYQTKAIYSDAVKEEGKRRRNANRDRGTEIHGAIEAFFHDDPVVPIYMPWVARAEEILEQYDVGVKVDYELTLVNTDLGYAGTCDISAPGIILDWKTGSRIYPDYYIQLWAYMEATHYVDADGMLQEIGTQPDLGVIAHVQQHTHETADLHRESKLYDFCGDTFKHLQGVKRWMDTERELMT